MSKNTNSSNSNKIKHNIIRKMQELFNGKTISSIDKPSEVLDISLSDEQEPKSTLHDSIKVDYSEVESLKQLIYSEANKDLTTKLEDMKKQYMLQNPDYNSTSHFTQTGLHDNSKDQDIQAMIHITDNGKVDLIFMCTDSSNISYHKDENGNFEYTEERQSASGKISTIGISSKYGLYRLNTCSYSNHKSPEQVAEAKHLSEKFSNPNRALKQAESSIPKESMENYRALRKKLGVESIRAIDTDELEKLASEKGISPEKLSSQKEKMAVLGSTKTMFSKDKINSSSLRYTYKEEALLNDGKPSQIWIDDLDSDGKVSLKLFELTKDGNYIDVSSYHERDGVPSIDIVSLEEIEKMAHEKYDLHPNPKMLEHFKSMAKSDSLVPKQTDLITKKIENDIQKGIKIGKNPEKNISPDIQTTKNSFDDIPI